MSASVAAPCAWEGGRAAGPGPSGSARRGGASSREREMRSEIFYVARRGFCLCGGGVAAAASWRAGEIAERSKTARRGEDVVSGAGGPAALTGLGSFGAPLRGFHCVQFRRRSVRVET